MEMSPINVAKNFLATNPHYNYLKDGKFTLTDHNSALDEHTIDQLPGVNQSDAFNGDYTVVTVEKNIKVGGPGDTTIPKIVKIQVSKKDDSILSVLESK